GRSARIFQGRGQERLHRVPGRSGPVEAQGPHDRHGSQLEHRAQAGRGGEAMTLEGVLDGMNPEALGAAVAVVRNGEVTDFAAKGLANIEHRVPITRETVHYLASTSKQFVATSI